ncbi:MAG: hypothetical protein V9G29_05645 [Burkholderiaceae bacterium]
MKDNHPFTSSGGLTPANVAAAIALTGADIVDVSSGVEYIAGHEIARPRPRFHSCRQGIRIQSGTK